MAITASIDYPHWQEKRKTGICLIIDPAEELWGYFRYVALLCVSEKAASFIYNLYIMFYQAQSKTLKMQNTLFSIFSFLR